MPYNPRMEAAYSRAWGNLVPVEEEGDFPIAKSKLTKEERELRREFEWILREIWWGAKPGGKAWWHLYALAADLKE